MGFAQRNRSLLGAVAAVVVLIAVGVVLLRTVGTRSHDYGTDDLRRITVSGGAQVAAEVITPKGSASHPLAVLPDAWGVPVTRYHLLALRLVRAGYVVVVYSQRGQVGSTGTIDYDGAATRADAGLIIDWALKNTHADASRIGMWGESYGAGTSLLAAADDRRIRAVVATSVGSDLAQSLAPNGTAGTQTLAELFRGARLDGDISDLSRSLVTDPQGLAARLAALSPTRSPMTYVDRLNHNGTAIMMANGFEDRVVGAGQLVPFYDALTTPKRLELQGGDHGGPGAAGLLGEPDTTTDDGVAWLDHYVRGVDNGIDTQAPIHLRDVVTTAWRTYRAWPTASAADTFDLASPGANAIGKSPTTWTAPLVTGVDTAATSGTGATYPPITASLGSLSSRASAAWFGGTVSAPVRVTGSTNLHLQVAAPTPDATFFVHLYDVGPTDQGRLMSFTPYTATGLTAGQARAVTIALEPIAWTLAADHRIAVVIDTVDPRYHSAAPAGTALTFSSTAADPATLSVPLG